MTDKCISCNKEKEIVFSGVCQNCIEEIQKYESLEPQTQEEYDFIFDHMWMLYTK